MFSSLFIFIIGLCFGSFLNVLADRWSNNQSILGRSHCPHCFATLRWFDLFPVVSFLFLGGRCRYCRQRIGWQYPLVELVTAFLFTLTFNFQPYLLAGRFSTFNSIYYLFIVSCLIVIFIADLKYYIIPNQAVYLGSAITIVYHILRVSPVILQSESINFSFVLNELGQYLGPYFLAVLLAGGFFFSLAHFSNGTWMGGGDVKLSFLMGLILGWPLVWSALFIAFTIGAIVGLFLVATKIKGWKSEIPFGTFLTVGTLATILWGERILVNWQMFWF